jgi:hypothetical protein
MKVFEEPIIIVEEIQVVDVITTSDGNGNWGDEIWD